MSHIIVKKIITAPTQYLDDDWFFEFQELPTNLTPSDAQQQVNKLRQQCSIITKKWDIDTNTEWLIREFMALKMLFTASVMLTSATYGIDKNIRITESYLQYYALSSCLRAILFTSPLTSWNGGQLIQSTHTKIINVSSDIIKGFSKELGEKIREYAFDLKDMREIYSYGAPSSGPKLCKDIGEISIENTISLCRTIAEIAQLQSEVLEKSIDKHYAGVFDINKSKSTICFEYTINGKTTFDNEDWYRFDYFVRKYPRPSNLLAMASEGHVEDYFGAWCTDEDDVSDVYDPDDDWRIIFPFP